MINRKFVPLRHAVLLFFSMLTVSLSPALLAKDLPWDETPYTHYSDQEPLSELLQELAADQKTPIVLSDKIDAVVSGYYKDVTPKEMFIDITKVNGLVWYFDGDTLFVNREDEMHSGSVSLQNVNASEFTKSLERLGVLDHYYHWVSSDIDGMVYFKGPEQFVSAVLEMSKVLDQKPKTLSIYKWVDNKGVTNFSTTLPKQYEKSLDVRVIEKNKGLNVLGEPYVQE